MDIPSCARCEQPIPDRVTLLFGPNRQVYCSEVCVALAEQSADGQPPTLGERLQRQGRRPA